MTVKTRGIRLKDHLPADDQGQRKLMQVTYSQLSALGQVPKSAEPPLLDVLRSQPPTPDRRRAIARMMRIELEATLGVLEQALEKIRRSTPPV
jgi:hypothetical protein